MAVELKRSSQLQPKCFFSAMSRTSMTSALHFFAKILVSLVVYSSNSCMLVMSFYSFFMLNVVDSSSVSQPKGGVITFKRTGFPL